MTEAIGNFRLDRIVRDVVARAVSAINPDRVWLFGSHARGTATQASDVDLAFELPDAARDKWTSFVVDARDEVPALIDLDLIDLGDCDPQLASEIITTGRMVYQRHP